MAYKGNVHDTRESPSLEVMQPAASRAAATSSTAIPWVPFVELEGTRHETRRVVGRTRCARPTASSCSRRTASSSSSRSGTQARLVVDTRNVVPPGPHVTRSERARCLDARGRVRRRRGGRQALARGDEVVLADNWYATDREQLAGLERGAGRDGRHPRAATAVAPLLAEGSDRVVFLAAQASRPLSVSRARLHRGDEPHRRAGSWRSRSRPADRSSPSAARCTSTAAGRG